MLAHLADLRLCALMSLHPYVRVPLCPCALMSAPLCPAAFCLRSYVLRTFICALMSGFDLTWVRIEPRSCNQGRRKYDAFTFSTTMPTNSPTAPTSCHLNVVVQYPPQWGWVETAGQISRGARPKGRPHCLGLFFRWAAR